MDGRFFCKEKIGTIQRKVAVDLIGGDLVIALYTELTAGVHHHLGAQDVGLEKGLQTWLLGGSG